MGFVTGLAGIREQQAKQPQNEDFADRPKAEWVSLKDGESVKVTPLQEIDEGSPNYNADMGLAIFSLQHSNPDNWKKNAECTVDEGDCYGCAQGWRQKTVFYINVLVEEKGRKPYVGILSRGLGKGSVAQSLLNMAADEDYNNSITDKTFKFARTGSTKDNTTYSLDISPNTPLVWRHHRESSSACGCAVLRESFYPFLYGRVCPSSSSLIFFVRMREYTRK